MTCNFTHLFLFDDPKCIGLMNGRRWFRGKKNIHANEDNGLLASVCGLNSRSLNSPHLGTTYAVRLDVGGEFILKQHKEFIADISVFCATMDDSSESGDFFS